MTLVRYFARIIVSLIEMFLTAIQIVVNLIVGKVSDLRVWLHRDYEYKRWLKRDLADCESILELGCGSNSPILQIGLGKKTNAVDIWQGYVDKHCRAGSYKRCMQGDIMKLNLPRKEFDAVVICDVLEHLPKELAFTQDLLGKIESCARKKVILFTPNGFVENDEVDGDPYQKHLSAWEPVDYLRRGYTVKGATGIRYILGKASLPKYRPHSLMAIIAMASQPWIFNRPEIAWHSYALKTLDKKD